MAAFDPNNYYLKVKYIRNYYIKVKYIRSSDEHDGYCSDPGESRTLRTNHTETLDLASDFTLDQVDEVGNLKKEMWHLYENKAHKDCASGDKGTRVDYKSMKVKRKFF